MSIQPVYLLIDASGSTQRSGLDRAYNIALPDLIGALEVSSSPVYYLSILTFGKSSSTQLALADVRTMQFIPNIASGGFSSIAAGLNLLGSVVFADAAQLQADGTPTLPALVVVVTDGLPTDSPEDVRLAYQDCCAQTTGLIAELLVVLAGPDVAASVAGLGQGLATPDVDVVELPVVDPQVLSVVVSGWITRVRAAGSREPHC